MQLERWKHPNENTEAELTATVCFSKYYLESFRFLIMAVIYNLYSSSL